MGTKRTAEFRQEAVRVALNISKLPNTMEA